MINIIGIVFIVAWVSLVVFFKVKKHRQAKKSGKPACCCGCSLDKEGNCGGNCK